jgi:hypothetical protein
MNGDDHTPKPRQVISRGCTPLNRHITVSGV